MSKKNNKGNNKKQKSGFLKFISTAAATVDEIEAKKNHKAITLKTVTFKELMEEDEEGKYLYEKYMSDLDEEEAKEKKKVDRRGAQKENKEDLSEIDKKVAKKKVKKKTKLQEEAKTQQKMHESDQDSFMAPTVIEDEDEIVDEDSDKASSIDLDHDADIVEIMKEEKMESLLDIVQESISKKKKKRINRIINKYLPQNIKRKYVDMGDGLYKIYIVSKDGSELIENIIDPFATMTGGTNPSIYKKGLNQDGSPSFKMVDLTVDKNLSTKLLTTKSFTDTEFYNSFNSAFSDPNLDFSNTEIIDKFNDSQEQEFMGNIYSSLNSLANAGIQVPRFRFLDLKSENQFTLVSDFNCKVPLKYESFEIDGVKRTLNINGYIDVGRIVVFNNGTISTYYVGYENDKLVLANAQTNVTQQPVTQQQMLNNAINNNMANGFMQQSIPNMVSNMFGGFNNPTPTIIR